MPYLRRMTYFSALRITHRVFAGVYKYRAPTEIFFAIYDTPTRTCHSGLWTVSACWCTSASHRKECKSFLSRTIQLHETCPGAVKQDADNPSVYRPLPKKKDQLPANGIPMVAIFLKWSLPRIRASPGHADAAGCNLALGRLRPSSKDIRGFFVPSAKPETSWIINFFSHRGTAPDLPSDFDRASLLSGLPREYNYTMFGGRTSPSGRRNEQMSLVASHILQVIKHASLSPCVLLKCLLEFCRAISLLI